MRQLTCFIASAFGKEDVNGIYDKAVIPVLKELKIKPLRVDKINHNSKIDNKILELINECDFGIADLTFARQSVYYEAGFIEGLGKAVVYIARSDHFKPKEKDVCENERIHFDLITKNIIPWIQPNPEFKSKLKSRIALVIKPLQKNQEKEREKSKSQMEFESISLGQRITLIEKHLADFLLQRGYERMSVKYITNVFEKADKRIIVEVHNDLSLMDIRAYSHRALLNADSVKNLSIIFCTLKSITKNKIEKALPHITPVSDSVYKYEYLQLIFITSINSIYKLNKVINDHLGL